MPSENLTRVEAQQRSSLIEVDSYRVEVDLTRGPTEFQTKTTVRFRANEIGTSSFIDAITARVDSVVLNGESLSASEVSDGARISLPSLAAENELVVDAAFRYSNSGEGLHRFVDPVDGEVYLYTQFEVPDSRRMFAVFEQPDLKASFEFIITAPAHWQVVSNSPTPLPNSIGDSVAVWSFEPTLRISSYITALIAGPYAKWSDSLVSKSGRTIPLGVFCRKSLAEHMDPEYIFDTTKRGFEFFETSFDYPYPFEKYDQLWVPDFNAGAMENAGAVTFTENYVFRSKVADATRERRVVTILHELAHMWFGDLVTMRWWNDLWLNESFAEYASTLATAETSEWSEAWTTFAALEKNWAYRQDQLPSTHPIVAEIRDLEDVLVNFDGITYAKGASVLRQLVAWVGREPFERGVARYFKKHAFGNTELPDLLRELEQESGRDLSSWSKLWLETAGVNTLHPELEVGEDGVIRSLKIRQTAIAEQPTIRPHRLRVGFFELSGDKVVRTDQIELDVAGPETAVEAAVGKKRPALLLLNDGDLAYAKIRLDEASHRFALANLSKIEDSLARTLIWTAAWDATRDGETPAGEFVDLVLENIAPETESTTILTLLRQLVTVGNLYVAPAKRIATLEKIGAGLIRLAESAAPGSDSQLQFAKFACQFVRTDEQLDWVEALYRESVELPGLEIDADMRWELLTALVVGGRSEEADIEAELSRDNTANGQKFAAAARAALPSPEAKSRAWHTLVETEEYSNTLTNSASLAFARVHDLEVLKPYQALYLSKVLEIWQGRSYHMAEYLLINLFPLMLANEALAAATREFLNKPELGDKPALRRILVENLANLERALKAQAADR